jgi:hypothetical protein
MKPITAGALGLVLGLVVATGISVWQAKHRLQTEPPAAAQRQADGSLVLERAATNAKAKPAAAIPKGGKAERIISVTVQPARADCPVCTLDLTVVRMPDDSRRVVASSPTGTVLGGLDIPVLPISIERKRPWAAGASRGTESNSWGIWLDRDAGRFRVGVEANKIGADIGGGDKYEARIKLGLNF